MALMLYVLPKGDSKRAVLTPIWHGAAESHYVGFINLNIFFLSDFCGADQGLSIFLIDWYHIGAIVGAPIYGALAGLGRKKNHLIHCIECIGVYIALALYLKALNTVSYTWEIRSFVSHGFGGTRKLRTFMDPHVGKALGGEFGFEGSFVPDINRFLLLMLFFGVANSSYAVCQASVCDVVPDELSSTMMHLCLGCFHFVYGVPMGQNSGALCFIWLDIDGACFLLAAVRFVQALFFGILSIETLGFERNAITDTPLPCYLKSIYNATYQWPYGAYKLKAPGIQMGYQRYHLTTLIAGSKWLETSIGLLPTNCIDWLLFHLLHCPVIGFMYHKTGAPAPMVFSLYMDGYNVQGHVGANQVAAVVMCLYPAFVGSYARTQDLAWFFAVSDSMRHLGVMLFDLGWAGALLCSNPAECWRSQYTYNHKLFDDMGGGQGRWGQIEWYLFCKSQKRQCCCPYRKLKADAPEKCCPPCCAGPYVEETGGCPCPCCCASCAS